MNGNPPLIEPPPPVDGPTVEAITGGDVTVGTDGDVTAVGGETIGETGDGGEDDHSCCPPDGGFGVVPVDESVVLIETSVTPDEPVDDGSVTSAVEDSPPIETAEESVDPVGASVGKMTPPPPMVGKVPPSGALGNSPLIEISVAQGASVVTDDATPAPRPPAPEPPEPTI
jgi:hypothetical protein